VRLLAGAVLAGGLVAGCGGGDLVLPNDNVAAAIRVVDGDGQQGRVGQLLASPIVVEVTDSTGNPVPGAAVRFVLLSAGDSAELQPSAATTDQQGRAQARMLLGEKVGLQTGEARLGQGPNPLTASFTAVATVTGLVTNSQIVAPASRMLTMAINVNRLTPTRCRLMALRARSCRTVPTLPSGGALRRRRAARRYGR